jgi:acetate kinase
LSIVSTVATILAINPGPAVFRAAVFAPDERLRIRIERSGTADAQVFLDGVERPGVVPADPSGALAAIAGIVDEHGLAVDTVSYRLSHGGADHAAPAVIDDALAAKLTDLVPLAPTRLPFELACIDSGRALWPDAVHVACFDTGFHDAMAGESRRLPVPAEWDSLGIRRYGSHGLSVQSVLDQLPQPGGVVIAHLGTGCSVTAVAHGVTQHTSASFTPSGGVLSATGSGDLDPEVLLYLMQREHYTVDQLRVQLSEHSGLSGVTNGHHDVRDLLDHRTDSGADLALRMLVADVAGEIAAAATALDRWEILVFTGGIGEHATSVREEICRHLLSVRGAHSGAGTPSQRLAASGLDIRVVGSDEERVLAQLAAGRDQ